MQIRKPSMHDVWIPRLGNNKFCKLLCDVPIDETSAMFSVKKFRFVNKVTCSLSKFGHREITICEFQICAIFNFPSAIQYFNRGSSNIFVDFDEYFSPRLTHAAFGVKLNWIGICYNQKFDNNKETWFVNIKMGRGRNELCLAHCYILLPLVSLKWLFPWKYVYIVLQSAFGSGFVQNLGSDSVAVRPVRTAFPRVLN